MHELGSLALEGILSECHISCTFIVARREDIVFGPDLFGVVMMIAAMLELAKAIRVCRNIDLAECYSREDTLSLFKRRARSTRRGASAL